jgi:hypothetical protein
VARIRTVKPAFWGSGKLARCSLPARLVAIGLLTESDDEGRLLAAPKRIAGALFPNDDDVTVEDVAGWMDELERVGFVRRYDVDGVRYGWIPGFLEHQRVSHPAKSTLPAPPNGVALDVLASGSGAGPERLRPEGEGEREREWEGETPVVGSADLVLVDPPADAPDPVEQVFEAWTASTGRVRTVLTPKRRKLIRRALDLYPLDDLVAAVRGWRHSPHHRGENDRHTVYNDLELLLRDAAKIERFRDLELTGGRAGQARALPSGFSAIQAAAEAELAEERRAVAP